MNLVQYVRSLVPSFTLTRVLTDITATQQELVESTLPNAKVQAEVMGTTKLKSRVGKSYDSHFKKQLEYKYTGNLFVAIAEILDNAQNNIPYLRKTVEQNFATDINKDSMNLIRLTLLRYVELLSFACSYTRRFTAFVVQNELNEDKSSKLHSSLLQVEIDWIGQNLDAYIQALNILAVRKDKLEQVLRHLPNVSINDSNVENVVSVSGDRIIDPLGFNLVAGTFQPFYRMALRIAEKQAAKHAEAKEEAIRLSLQIQHWKLLQQRAGIGEEELVKLQKAIDYTEQRVRDAQYKMHRLENDD